MGWSFNRGFNFGPFRLNVGSGGVGVSVGFSGLRLGLNRRGVYVHFGRGGLYYRRYLFNPLRSIEAGRDDP